MGSVCPDWPIGSSVSAAFAPIKSTRSRLCTKMHHNFAPPLTTKPPSTSSSPDICPLTSSPVNTGLLRHKRPQRLISGGAIELICGRFCSYSSLGYSLHSGLLSGWCRRGCLRLWGGLGRSLRSWDDNWRLFLRLSLWAWVDQLLHRVGQDFVLSDRTAQFLA